MEKEKSWHKVNFSDPKIFFTKFLVTVEITNLATCTCVGIDVIRRSKVKELPAGLGQGC